MNRKFDVIVVGGGQSGLAVGYYLRRTGLTFAILDKEEASGGAWQHHWNSLRLFSPAQWSSLPGVIMPGGGNYYPSREETIQYLRDYERRYQLPVMRPVEVKSVSKTGYGFQLVTTEGLFDCRAVVSATGSFDNPFIPKYPGSEIFQGEIIHSSQYVSAEPFKAKRVAVVGEGNSGAQILAEISQVAQTLWITQNEPSFLADHVDGRYLFDAASQMYEAKKQGKAYKSPTLREIVMVPPVKEARARGVFELCFRPFSQFTPDGLQWQDGHQEKVDVVIFCTGFKPSLQHLSSLNVISDECRVKTEETRAVAVPGLWLVGYGDWTGFASATLIGVGRTARSTVEEIITYLSKS